ncbi:MAG: Cell division ATP-binding protein FtsE [candidate division CPR1 bacterium GW2011_GWA2_42_17]|uniref:Cell division ATP-binding protein FtsE n=1 Tax=candidate division CPR1 bacterium GW2011_GWA2_42_17 TaxID=1618341 RepID=A0A0G0Z636_9BACT|nr:MAG: Cell division ATP-binding protein FtsE [candidate division CPR1 bacterium GW2011_GWA2_42_17]
MISFQGITKVYPKGVEALRGVDLEISDGEFLFLVGPSGAGKTTLLKFLIREDLPSSGAIIFKDEDIVGLADHLVPQLRRQIGMVFQDFKLLEKRTVFENVAFALEVLGRNDNDIAQMVPFILQKVGLSEKLDFYPRQLSSGEQQRVAIARALIHEPEVLLADEPTGNLDYENSWQIINLLKQINEWGTTVIMATHDRTIVDSMKKRVVTLERGLIVKDE